MECGEDVKNEGSELHMQISKNKAVRIFFHLLQFLVYLSLNLTSY